MSCNGKSDSLSEFTFQSGVNLAENAEMRRHKRGDSLQKTTLQRPSSVLHLAV